MMRSESTSAFGQPSDTKLTFGAASARGFFSATLIVISIWLVRLVAHCSNGVQHSDAALVDRILERSGFAPIAHFGLTLDRALSYMGIYTQFAQRIGDFFHLVGAAC